MENLFASPIFIGGVAFVLSIILTYAVRGFARKYNFVAKPKSDRWHKKPTALMGGVAIFLATILVYLVFVPKTTESWVIIGGSALLFVVGMIDDVFSIKPYQKLIGQLIGVAFVIGAPTVFGEPLLVLNWTGSEIINIWITSFWIVGITNAINLLDNMDGLAAGISAIAALTLAIVLGGSEGQIELLLICGFIGSLLGFLVFNSNPASIFMGDSGSMFVGFFLACSVLLNQVGGRSRGIFTVLAVPALILFVPIFDTTFVTVLRKVWGRKATTGGRDHTSHRLVALGLSERSAVLMLYGFAILAGAISLSIMSLPVTQGVALIAFFSLVLVLVGVYLAKVKVYEEQDEAKALKDNKAHGFLLDLSYKRRVFEVILDAILITLCYYASYLLLFTNFEQTWDWDSFVKSLPILIVMNLGSFLAVGVYQGIWRYTSISDFVTFAKGVLLGSGGSVLAILLLYRFQGFSRAVFVINAVFMLVALAASRMAFRLFRQLLPNPMKGDGRRVLIYGAGDGGEMVLRELQNNLDWKYKAVGFIDDDALKKDKVVHGLKVYGGSGSLKKICVDNDIEEILISFRELPADRLEEVREACSETRVRLKRALIKIEAI
jgi:UDP-GlcNAc:undecaprenyl-phosphate GlcNAc-1-phosphate transferase